MSRIENVETARYRIPLPAPLADSTHGEMTHFDLIVCRLRDADGAEGVGYTVTMVAGGAIHALLRDDLAPLIRGAEADRPEALWQRLYWHVHYPGRGGAMAFALSAADIACWDLKARRAGEPLWRHLGGHDPSVAAYAGGVDLHLSVDDLLRQTQDNLARGFRAIKMKVGRPRLAEDVARVQAMRGFLGDGFPLMVDANMGWRVDQALAAARRLADFALVWLEEPIIPDDVAGHVRLARDGGIAIATGENFHTLHEFTAMIAAGGVQFPEPDVTTCGGVTVWMKVARLAEAHNLPVTSHGAHDLTVHLLAAVPNKSWLEVHGYGLDRFVAAPLALDGEGRATAPDRPGHGIAFDWAALGRLQVS
jgi:L-alanine-DL-glutamate epimerase-like enolase superfamily enzyme